MWGGLDRKDRTEIAKEYGFPVPAVLPDHGTNARRVKHGCDCRPCKDAHALYERERRERARLRRQLAEEAVAPPPPPQLRLDLGEYRARTRRRTRQRQ
jgi:hypothetical protein